MCWWKLTNQSCSCVVIHRCASHRSYQRRISHCLCCLFLQLIILSLQQQQSNFRATSIQAAPILPQHRTNGWNDGRWEVYSGEFNDNEHQNTNINNGNPMAILRLNDVFNRHFSDHRKANRTFAIDDDLSFMDQRNFDGKLVFDRNQRQFVMEKNRSKKEHISVPEITLSSENNYTKSNNRIIVNKENLTEGNGKSAKNLATKESEEQSIKTLNSNRNAETKAEENEEKRLTFYKKVHNVPISKEHGIELAEHWAAQ